jgi:hypothetical protein
MKYLEACNFSHQWKKRENTELNLLGEGDPLALQLLDIFSVLIVDFWQKATFPYYNTALRKKM